MAKVALILGCNIPYTFKFGYVIPNKLECSAFLYPPLYWCSVALADFRQELECSRIAQAHIKVVQSGIHLQHNQNNLLWLCVHMLRECVWVLFVVWWLCVSYVVCLPDYALCVCMYTFSTVIPFSGL